MHSFTYRTVCWLLCLGYPLTSLAAHQVGGQLEMQAVGDVPGHYRIIITNYFEAGSRADAQAGGQLGIFRNRDNALLFSFYARRTGADEPILFSNEFCAKMGNLNLITVLFEVIVQLDPADYADPGGYYLTYQSRNRNAGLINIRESAETGFTYYLSFPPLLQNGQPVNYSSPHFPPINGEYICLGEPFTFPFGATDPDGDELRYSLVTPLNLVKNQTQNLAPGPYPGVLWQSGFGPDNAIPGNPALQINAQTGELSVTATQVGLFVFGVNVEEYRNGRKIGEVRRDYQLLVIDCPTTTMPSPVVQVKNQSAPTLSCRGDSVVLQTTADPNWNYQWRKNGVNLPSRSEPSITVREIGDYSVVVSAKNACINPGISKPVTVRPGTVSRRVNATGYLCTGGGGSVLIQVTADADATYQWYRDNRRLTGQKTDSVRVSQEGRYWAILTEKSSGCIFQSDTLQLTRREALPATIRSVTGHSRLCPQDSLTLASTGGVQYSWQKDGVVISDASDAQYRAKTAGNYVVTAISSDGCQRRSVPFVVESIQPVTVVFDSIPPICDASPVTITLRGNPAGGVFAGLGVTENKFDARRAGVGNHLLTYTLKAAPECAGTVASQTAVVFPSPTIELPDTLLTYLDGTVSLTPVLTGDPVSFAWTPATYLNNPAIANPSVVSVAGNITYTLTIENKAGCRATDTVHLMVIDRIWVPDAFTPNGDGMNDLLILPGIRAFPEAVITLYNRWGDLVYQSRKGYPIPFDGTFNGTFLPTGVYPYTLRTFPNKPAISGRLLLLRE